MWCLTRCDKMFAVGIGVNYEVLAEGVKDNVLAVGVNKEVLAEVV